MTLSPAAQATWDALNDAYEAQGPLEDMGQPIGAALRAAVEQAIPEADSPDGEEWLGQSAWIQAEQAARHRLLKIATELETPQ